MRRVARVAALVIAGFAALAGGSGPVRAAEGLVLDKIVAVVGDEIILLSQLDTLVASSPLLQEALQKYGRNPTQQQVEMATREARTQALDELIDQQLIKKEAQRFQISITDADVDRYLQQIAQENGFRTPSSCARRSSRAASTATGPTTCRTPRTSCSCTRPPARWRTRR
ncbi:SurA N-terminal domain-containing protein [Nannocystis pusilla]|uniref:SurA N-terminal domain-containing protein n=1 Tax=Nannocystis pusilla TaxID=889268 RepID=UPI003B7D23B7